MKNKFYAAALAASVSLRAMEFSPLPLLTILSKTPQQKVSLKSKPASWPKRKEPLQM